MGINGERDDTNDSVGINERRFTFTTASLYVNPKRVYGAGLWDKVLGVTI